MKKVFYVALREFLSTVATKGFIFGILLVPVLVGAMILVLPLFKQTPPKIDGEVAVLDPTGILIGGVREYLEPEAMAERVRKTSERIDELIPVNVKKLGGEKAKASMDEALEMALGSVPELTVVELAAGADLEEEKALLLAGNLQDGGRLAVAVVHGNAVEPAPETGYGSYDLFVREKLDDRIEDEIRSALRQAIVAARMDARGLEQEEIQALTRIETSGSTTVTKEGERETNPILNMLLPAGFMILLLISVFTGGQYLMTTTIEEKSSRVVEVLLSAVSPMELMTGKVVGQMTVGFLILALYAGMGILALLTFSLMGFIELSLFFYLIVFFVIAYFVVASLMAAVGAAVNEMREAQTLMTPIILIMMIPWMLWMPISRDPNSLFATVTSLVPPINSFVMMLRISSTTPPPLWQVWLSIAIGAVSVWVALKIAAKVFRVGILMYGRPPNFRTLVKWVRMA